MTDGPPDLTRYDTAALLLLSAASFYAGFGVAMPDVIAQFGDPTVGVVAGMATTIGCFYFSGWMYLGMRGYDLEWFIRLDGGESDDR